MKKKLPMFEPHQVMLPGSMANASKPVPVRTGFYSCLMTLFLLLLTSASFAHVTEIRVNQAQDGSLTWYLSSYHSANECGVGGSGLMINGVKYPLQSTHSGDVATMSPNIFAKTSYNYAHTSYAIVRTPYLGNDLSVQPYSNNVCWAFMVGGRGSFTPPPPPVCTTSPLTGWTNTLSATGDNKGTACYVKDDTRTATIKVAHLACANITGDKQFRVIYDPTGANIAYGPFNYASGVETNVVISIPYGASNATQVQVIDDDFPAQITHGLSIPNGQYLGEKETVPPSLSVASPMQVGTDKGVCGAVVNYPAPVAADNCGPVKVTQIAGLASGAVFPVGTTTNAFQATDAAGNTTTASFTVTVKDSEGPAVAAKNFTVNLKQDLSASISAQDLDNGSKDACGPVTLRISSGRTTFACADIGQTFPVVLTATDQQGLTSSVTVQVTVADPGSYCNRAPVAVAKPLTISADANCQASSTPQAFDNGSSDADGDGLSFSVLPAGPYGLGTTPVKFTVTDTRGASNTVSTTVTVVDRDAPVPTVAVLPTLRAECSLSLTPPTAKDNCSGAIRATTSDPLTYTTQGNYSVTWTYTDAHGNSSQQTQQVVVKDVTPPSIAAPAAFAGVNDPGKCGAVVDLAVPKVSDNCGVALVTNDAPAGNFFPVGTTTITWTVKDVNGLSTTVTQTVTVRDAEAPVALAQSITVQLDENGKAEITPEMIGKGSSDACGIKSLALSQTAFDCSNVGANTVTLTVTDNNGNVSTTTAVVTVEDKVAPVAVAKDITVSLVNGAAIITAAQVDNGSSDACGIASMTLSKTSFTCDELGSHSVTLTVTDKNGNVHTAPATVTVNGVKPAPAIAVSRTDNTYTGPGTEQTIFLGYGAQSLILTASNATSAAGATTYNWSPAMNLSDANAANPVFSPTAEGTYTYTVTATNEFGCSASTTVTLTVIDVRATRSSADKTTAANGIVVCHNGHKTIVAYKAVQAHLAHNCTLGACVTKVRPNARVVTDMKVANEMGLVVYPNPVVNHATVEFTLLEEGDYQVEVYDMKGALIQVVGKGHGEANKFYSFVLDTTAYPAGTYLVKLATSEQVLTKRMVVQK